MGDGWSLRGIACKFDGRLLVGYTSNAGWSSLVARRAHNPKVVSSNLTPATILRNTTLRLPALHSEAFFLGKMCSGTLETLCSTY
jgi:hypothetical protein